MKKTFQCQVNGKLSAQACGSREADSIYRCEVIGPHERHLVGRHTIEHSLAGNGFLCEFVEMHLESRLGNSSNW